MLYDPFGPVGGWTWGNASLTARIYDLDGNLDQLDSGGLKTYAQDDAFRITGITDAADPNKSWSYGYDLLDRLSTANRTGLAQGWSYDASGNRLSQTGTSPSTYAMAGTSNRLNGVSGALSRSFSYDAAGNATADGSAGFGYDGAGRMTSATVGATTTTYALNALGQRVRKTTAGVSTIFVYDESGQLLGEYAGGGELIREYVWLGDIPVAVVTGGPGTPPYVFWYIHTDHLNAPRSVQNPTTGVQVWRWDSAPFGETQPNQDPDGDLNLFTLPLRFPGQYADVETGLNYNYFRDYEPRIGRYVQSDPIGLNGGPSTYAYVGNRPTFGVDPLGLMLCGDWGWMAFDWATGLGSRNRRLGAHADQSAEIQGLPQIDRARNEYRRKNKTKQQDPCCDPRKLEPVTNWDAGWKLPEIAWATFNQSCAAHFLGNFRIDIFPVTCDTARIVITNNSSFTSFTGGYFPSWEGGPMGNLHQTYQWEERL